MEGHGAAPATELGGFRVMINTKFTYDEGSGDFPTDNDYRRIGLVINPNKFGTEELTSDLTLSATKAVIFAPTFTGNFRLMKLLPNLARWWSAGNCKRTGYIME